VPINPDDVVYAEWCEWRERNHLMQCNAMRNRRHLNPPPLHKTMGAKRLKTLDIDVDKAAGFGPNRQLSAAHICTFPLLSSIFSNAYSKEGYNKKKQR
jgi:hypothetical protein